MFVETVMFHLQSQKKQSLSDLCNDIFVNYGIDIKKQSLDQRFSKNTSLFFKRLLEKSIAKLFSKNTGLSVFKHFNMVKIKDSTSFELPGNMKELYPGNSGFSSESGMSIQFEYDLKSNNITDIGLHPKKVNDYKNAHETISKVTKDDLIIRDLGYISIDLLKNIDNKGAFFINRIKPQTIIFKKTGGKFVRISINGIISHLRKTGKLFIEKNVYIGDKKFLPCRAVFILIPDDKLKERKKRQLGKSKRRGGGTKIDPKVLEALELNIFITNTKKEHVPGSEIFNIYRLRWQIELIFKTWKQICKISSIKQVKALRIETMIYAQLLWITTNWSIVSLFIGAHFRYCNKLLSIYKLFKTMKLVSNRLRTVLKSRQKLEEFIVELEKLFSQNHFKEKRKGKVFSEDILIVFKG